ncbi:hypothetical protein FOMPIDRAFT_1130903 [Fomitopsis schrenkii]|uniref:BTB domain-containing protein n=1 Tax=Fomitopsis schrenkii TaxID=2126942 RepID=S8F3A9_FOMSC|nr:hypothetical protein FOMPIDRAFT_1130903 [Fomitopsis schrenkii]
MIWTVRADDADVTMVSCDGVLFKVHRKNLEMYTEGFPGVDVSVHDEIVPLTETAATLELLFQYMYRQRQPDLNRLEPEQLAKLAEAAEKYQVYSAIEVCKMRMQSLIETMPMIVLGYAAKHGYKDLAKEAAPHTIDVSAVEAAAHLNVECFYNWVGAFRGVPAAVA